MKDNKKGFTLIELLAVIAILAILMLLVIPRLVKSIKSSKKDTFYDNVTLIYNTAILEYVDDNAQNDEYCDTCSNNLGNKIPNKFEYKVKFEEDKLIYIRITDKEYIYVKSDKNGINKKDLNKDDVKEYDPNTPSKDEDSKSETLIEKLLNDNPTISTRTNFSTAFTTNTANTLYKATENGTDVYYFAGRDTTSTPINNWIKFGKNSSNQDLYWRIIRTNSDGSIRLLYHGTSTTATDAYIGKSKFNEKDNDSMYVGYMYGTSGSQESNRTNANDSTIKTLIDNWYASNMTSYTKYLSTTAVYCNDREVGSGTYSATGSKFYYAAYTRLYTNKTPTYDCTNDNDKFTVDASSGNGKLTYPIALMTADEIAYAGGVAFNNAPMWYYTNSSFKSSTGTTYWWSLSPNDWRGGYATSWYVLVSGTPGRLVYNNVYYSNGVRPVVSLKSCTLYRTGNGTSETPYEIEMNGRCK